MLQREPFFTSSRQFWRNKFGIFPLLLFFLISQSGYSQIAETQKNVLEPGEPVARELSGGEKISYQINLSANQYAKIVVRQEGIDIIARLLSDDGKTIVENNFDPQLQGQEIIELTAKNPAVFTLLIWAKQNNAAGHYEIRIEEIRTATDKDFVLDEARRLDFEATNLWLAFKYNEALPLAKRALDIREKELGTNNVDYAASLVIIANITSDNGDYETSESLYLRALAVKEKLLGKDDISVSAILNNLGLLYKSKGDYVKAESALRRTLEIREKTLEPNHLLIASILNNLASLSRIKGDKAKAAEYYRRSLEIRQKALPPDSPDVATSFMNLANLYPDVATAEPLYTRALAIRERVYGTESPNVAEILYNLAVLYNEAGDTAKAEPLGRRALAIYEKALGAEHPLTSYALNLLAAISKNNGDYAQAESLYRRAIAIKEKVQGVNHPDLINAYSDFSGLYALKGEIGEAVSKQSRANDILEFNLELNLTTGSEREKLDYLKTLDEFADQTLTLNFQTAPDSEAAANLAAEMILRRKGRVLDAMANSIGALRGRLNPQDRNLLDDLEKINKQISQFVLEGGETGTAAEYQAKIQALTGERDETENKISLRAAGFYEKTKAITLSEIQPLIQKGSALVEFTVYNSVSAKKLPNAGTGVLKPHYAVYVLHDQGAAEGLDLGETEQIDKAIDAFRGALRDPQRKDVQKLARTVDKKIMQPVRALLGGAKQLLVSPDGELNLIPFEALVDEKNQYLIENYSFAYLTSGRDLLRMQTPRESKSKPLIIANPLFGAPLAEKTTKSDTKTINRRRLTAAYNLPEIYFAPLGGTALEARSIQNIFPDFDLLTGAQATKSALKQKTSPRILHIATHGFFLPETDSNLRSSMRGLKSSVKLENPLLRSGLALAGANRRSNSGDDGILTALEASGLNLWGTKLVVLSACDTSLGEIKTGEGVYGLRRAFVLAGAESLVMSLWSVSDYATHELMTSYYKNLKQGAGRGAALRQVQLEMLERKGREHPFYWAGFIQSGEWANLDGKR